MTSFQQIVNLANDARTRIREITPELAGLPGDEGRIFLDVREKNEYDAGHIPGAIQLSWLQLEARIALAIPDKSTPVLAYCAIGHRSAIAADILQSLGYQDVVSLQGGLQAYQSSQAGRKFSGSTVVNRHAGLQAYESSQVERAAA
ncbi:MAG: rhodanese-like domain-containing protein [Methylococcus sp.]